IVITPIMNDGGSHNCIVINRAQIPVGNYQSATEPGPTDFNSLQDQISQIIQNACTARWDFSPLVNFAWNQNSLSVPGEPIQSARNLVLFCQANGYYWAVRPVLDFL